MEQPSSSSSIFIVLGFLIIGGFSPLLAQSENPFNGTGPLNNPPPSPLPPPPPPLSPPPPPPLLSPPPPPSSHPPPPSHPPPHSPPPPPTPPPPPPKRKHDPKKNTTAAKAPSHSNRSLPPEKHHQSMNQKKTDRKINTGKKIGLLFAGIAGILQVAVVGFLVIKGWQISKLKDRDVDSSS